MSGQWHPDPTALAEYRAGLAGGRRGRRLAAHVASCGRCASVSGRLAGVTSALASASVPVLPEAVEHRITAALAAEAATATGTARDMRSRSASRDGAEPPRRPGWSGPGWGARLSRQVVLASVAAACLVLFGGVYLFGIAHVLTGSSSSSAASSSAGSALAAPAVAPAAGSAQAPHGALGPAKTSARAAFLVTESGTRYQAATLAAQVRTRLAAAKPASGTVANPVGHTPSAALAACVLHLTGQAKPSLVDWATYQGKPAYVIAVANRAWVVGPGCTVTDPELVTSIGL